MSQLPRIAVAMSGGVDSSVAAALLVEQGYPVIGVMLRLWSADDGEDSNRCCSTEAVELARRVAGMLHIPFYALDTRETFRKIVVEEFLQGKKEGVTPNPCIVCNNKIRWGYLLDRIDALGAEVLATGHYARLVRDTDGRVHLLKSRDSTKDQTYMLSSLSQEQLQKTIFPLGEIKKTQVREKARLLSFPVADRVDSQDLCFLGNLGSKQFILKYQPESAQTGEIVDEAGKKIGLHHGLAFHTVGQRRGLGISSKKPLYVKSKDLQENRLIVSGVDQLFRKECEAGGINWIEGNHPEGEMDLEVKIRYQAKPSRAVVIFLSGQAIIRFIDPQRDITPGQQAVFYRGDTCLGSGTILP